MIEIRSGQRSGKVAEMAHIVKESEEDFQTWVIDTLHTAGFLVYHPRPGQSRTGRYSTPLQGDEGFPDIVAAKTNPRGGRVIFAHTPPLSMISTVLIRAPLTQPSS